MSTCIKKLKKIVGKYTMMQKWSYRIWEWFLNGKDRTRKFRYVCCEMILPLSVVTYPFNKKLKPDKDLVYTINEEGRKFYFYVPDFKTDIMQRYYLLTDNFHDHCFLPDFTKDILSPKMIILDVGGKKYR